MKNSDNIIHTSFTSGIQSTKKKKIENLHSNWNKNVARSHYPGANFTCANLNALKEIIFQPQPKWSEHVDSVFQLLVNVPRFNHLALKEPGRLSHIIPLCNNNNRRMSSEWGWTTKNNEENRLLLQFHFYYYYWWLFWS